MQSPTKAYPKKPRKNNTFSQVNMSNNEVGFFQEGYFVMPDPNIKETDGTPKNKNTHTKTDRPPSRRKHTNDSTLPLSPSHPKKSQQPYFVDTPKKDSRGEVLLTPGSLSTKLSKNSHIQCSEPFKSSPCVQPTYKDMTACSPPSSGRWAGPAFGNAPHPSSLPLPEWTGTSTDSTPLNGPKAHLHAPVAPSYSPLPAQSSSDMPYHAIPVVPFPYVESSAPPLPSLTQLSIDLRRLLNINGSMVSSNNDPILVTANSY